MTAVCKFIVIFIFLVPFLCRLGGHVGVGVLGETLFTKQLHTKRHSILFYLRQTGTLLTWIIIFYIDRDHMCSSCNNSTRLKKIYISLSHWTAVHFSSLIRSDGVHHKGRDLTLLSWGTSLSW